MMHDDAVLALAFSRDGERCACGDKAGHPVHVASGKCARRFEHAHGTPVSCVAFAKDARSS